jgi:hypothetical protein
MNLLLLPFTLTATLLVVYGSLTRVPYQRFAPFLIYESPEYKVKMSAYRISDDGGLESSVRAYGKAMVKLDGPTNGKHGDAEGEEMGEKKRLYEAALEQFHHMKEDITQYIKLIKSNIGNAAEIDGQRFVWLLSNNWQHYVMERGPPPENPAYNWPYLYFYYEGVLYRFPAKMTKADDLRAYFDSALGWEPRRRITEWSGLGEEFRREYELHKSRSLSCQDSQKDELEKASHYASSRYTMNRERLETEVRLLEGRLKNDLPMLVEIALSLVPATLPNALQPSGKFAALNGKHLVLAMLSVAFLWGWLLSVFRE